MSFNLSTARFRASLFVCLGLLCAMLLPVTRKNRRGDGRRHRFARRGERRTTRFGPPPYSRARTSKRAKPASVQELLADLAGINIVNNGGLGKLSSVFMRGAESDHTLLLIDGVRVASATAGHRAVRVDSGGADRAHRDRARPALHALWHRCDRRRDPDLHATCAATRLSLRRRSRAAAAMTRVSFGAQLRGARRACLGERRARSPSTPTASIPARAARPVAFAACFADEPDRDGFRNNSGSLAAGYAFNDSWRAQLNSLDRRRPHGIRRLHFRGNEAEFGERVLSLSLDGALSAGWHARACAGAK